MTQKFQSGCKTPIGGAIQSNLNVRGCFGQLLFGYALSVAYKNDITGDFETDFYQPSLILDGQDIEELVPLGTFNTSDVNGNSMGVFRFFKDRLYAMGNFIAFPTPPSGSAETFAFWSEVDQFWVEPAPSTDKNYESMAFSKLTDELILSGNISLGVGVANTENLLGYDGGVAYSSVHDNTPGPGAFQGSCVVSEFDGTVVASDFEEAFQDEAVRIYRGNGLWDHLFYYSPGGASRLMNVDMKIGLADKQEVLMIEGSSTAIKYWDGVAVNSQEICPVGSITSMTRYKKGVAFCCPNDVRYWDGQVVVVLADKPVEFVFEHNGILFGAKQLAFTNNAGDTVEGLLKLVGGDWQNAYVFPEKEGFTQFSDNWVTNLNFHTAEPFFSLPGEFVLRDPDA